MAANIVITTQDNLSINKKEFLRHQNVLFLSFFMLSSWVDSVILLCMSFCVIFTCICATLTLILQNKKQFWNDEWLSLHISIFVNLMLSDCGGEASPLLCCSLVSADSADSLVTHAVVTISSEVRLDSLICCIELHLRRRFKKKRGGGTPLVCSVCFNWQIFH